PGRPRQAAPPLRGQRSGAARPTWPCRGRGSRVFFSRGILQGMKLAAVHGPLGQRVLETRVGPVWRLTPEVNVWNWAPGTVTAPTDRALSSCRGLLHDRRAWEIPMDATALAEGYAAVKGRCR